MTPIRRIIRLVDKPQKIRPTTKLKPLALRLLAAGMTRINQVTR